jgi:hypothetical protein
VDIIMTNPTPMAHWRLRMPAGACGVIRLADNLNRLHGTGASVFGYTPATVDVVQGDEFPGVPAWSPPVY